MLLKKAKQDIELRASKVDLKLIDLLEENKKVRVFSHPTLNDLVVTLRIASPARHLREKKTEKMQTLARQFQADRASTLKQLERATQELQKHGITLDLEAGESEGEKAAESVQEATTASEPQQEKPTEDPNTAEQKETSEGPKE